MSIHLNLFSKGSEFIPLKNILSTILTLILVNGVYGQFQFGPIYNNSSMNLHEAMMKSTFLIKGDDSLGFQIEGTCFVLSKPASDHESKDNMILITSNHVLSDIHDEFLVLVYSDKNESIYTRHTKSVRIRNNGQPLWKTIQDSIIDIAAIKLKIDDFRIDNALTTEYLADEEVLKYFQISPGDMLNCVGFPEGISSNEFGFPILKSGKIASYPLIPTSQYKYFLFDCEVFPASSGSPVYLSQSGRHYNDDSDSVFDTNLIQFICGIVVSKTYAYQDLEYIDSEKSNKKISLQLAKVIPSTFIIEVLNQIE